MVQSVKHLTPDFSSGHDLTLVRQSPASGSMLIEGLSLSPTLSKEINKLKNYEFFFQFRIRYFFQIVTTFIRKLFSISFRLYGVMP